jgi:hypothetical protein
MSEFVTANTTAMSTLGARVMVLGKFLDAALPHLTELQRADVTQSFRQGIEDGMVQMDDMALAAAYHSTLLELTNTILTALRQGSATRDQPHILAPGAELLHGIWCFKRSLTHWSGRTAWIRQNRKKAPKRTFGMS